MNPVPLAARVTPRQRIVLLGLPLVVGLVTPSLTRVAVAVVVGHKSLGSAITDILGALPEMFIISVVGLIPFVVLAVVMRRIAASRTRRACCTFCISGLIGILALMIPGHVAVWDPLYGPGRVSSTGSIAFVFIPLYCTVTLLYAMLIAHFITKIRWFQAIPAGLCQHCGYNLTGNLSGVCPECGESTSS
jgi:hypothetical protein